MKDKKNLAMIIIVGIVIVLFLCVNTTVFATTGTVVGDNLRLRKEQSSSSEILDLLDANDKVEILGEDGDWYKVKANSKVGYVNKQYIKVSEGNIVINEDVSKNEEKVDNTANEQSTENNELVDNNQEQGSQTPVQPENQQTEQLEGNIKINTEESRNVKVTTDAELKVTPLINGIVVNMANPNETYEVISKVGFWSYVKSGEKTGWILTEKTIVADKENAQNVVNNSKTGESPEVKGEKENKPEENKPEESNKVEENKNEENKTQENKQDVSTEKMYSSSKTYYVKGDSVNVRSGASKSSNVVKALSVNTSVKVIGEDGTWYIIELNGTRAYVSKSLLSSKKVEVTSRSSNSISANNQTATVTTQSQAKPEPTAPVASNPSGNAIVEYAKTFLGYRYVYGTNGPNTFDCSGFVQYVYKHFGYSLSRSSGTQANDGVAVSKSNLQPGDVLIFRDTSNTRIGHVGIYIGGDQFIHASNSRTGVIISSLSTSAYQKRYVGARRIL